VGSQVMMRTESIHEPIIESLTRTTWRYSARIDLGTKMRTQCMAGASWDGLFISRMVLSRDTSTGSNSEALDPCPNRFGSVCIDMPLSSETL
jgi:hypothetical protein